MMHMTFYWGKEVTILFSSWRTDSWLSYAISLLVCLLFSAFYQYLEDKRLKFMNMGRAKKPSSSDNQTPLLIPILGKRNLGKRFWLGLSFGVNSAIGYMLMLAVMSFNGGVFIAIVLGLCIGFVLFRCDEEEDGDLSTQNPCACA
ncbi:hypothetical protein MKW94_018057 [Papaver nudicaule]|uniref:Copper transport protein n=1 Tax=Papaver nudicaule TaxID=74823 RepID=A0AA41VSD5_PAPNU|nr:hypothetical protein [Papaver nudicaule]